MASTAASPETLATDLKDVLRGHVEDEKIEAAATKLPSLAPCCPTHGSFSGPEIEIVVDGGKTFRGDAGGVAGSDGPGQVWTGDLDALYGNTVSFAMTATQVYTAVYFFDDQGNLLGYFRAGPLFPGGEIMVGKGHWS
jgi:Rhodococcus equi virulence-associated protein